MPCGQWRAEFGYHGGSQYAGTFSTLDHVSDVGTVVCKIFNDVKKRKNSDLALAHEAVKSYLSRFCESVEREGGTEQPSAAKRATKHTSAAKRTTKQTSAAKRTLQIDAALAGRIPIPSGVRRMASGEWEVAIVDRGSRRIGTFDTPQQALRVHEIARSIATKKQSLKLIHARKLPRGQWHAKFNYQESQYAGTFPSLERVSDVGTCVHTLFSRVKRETLNSALAHSTVKKYLSSMTKQTTETPLDPVSKPDGVKQTASGEWEVTIADKNSRCIGIFSAFKQASKVYGIARAIAAKKKCLKLVRVRKRPCGQWHVELIYRGGQYSGIFSTLEQISDVDINVSKIHNEAYAHRRNVGTAHDAVKSYLAQLGMSISTDGEPEETAAAKPTIQNHTQICVTKGAPWYYADLQGKIQGPYGGDLMRQWIGLGYLKGDLQIGQNPEGPFQKLSFYISDHDEPLSCFS
ncbi:hypothetical protein ACHAWF_008814 [Thalassiosira exigua]